MRSRFLQIAILGALALWGPNLLRAQDAGAPVELEANAAPAEQASAPVEPERPVEGWRQLRREALEQLSELTNLDLGGNSSLRLALCFAILLLALVARRLVVGVFTHWLTKLSQRTNWSFDDRLVPALRGPVGMLTLVIGVFLALGTLSFSRDLDLLILRLFQASTLTVVFWGVLRMVDVVAETLVEVARERDLAIYHFIPLLKKSARIFLIIVASILVVQNLGYSVGSLLTGLGIGGLAVALAAQESLGNFFGSISLVADRPFKVGDWIQVGSKIDGDVEEIGLRSTKVRTWAKSQLTIPNKVLANEIVENWSRMPKRRVKQVVAVAYTASPEDMDGLVEDIRQLLREDEGVHQEFLLVNFTDFGPNGLEILVYYFTKTIKWLEHMDVRQRVNLKIMRAIRARGASIALPPRSLHLEGDVARSIARGFAGGREPGA